MIQDAAQAQQREQAAIAEIEHLRSCLVKL